MANMLSRILVLLAVLILPTQPYAQIPEGKGESSKQLQIRTYGSRNFDMPPTVRLPWLQIHSGVVRRVSISAYYSYPGENSITPDRVILGLTIEPCTNIKSAVIWVNGKCMYKGTLLLGLCMITLSTELISNVLELPVDIFLIIASGEDVEVEIGDSKVKLTKNHLDLFLELANRTRK